MSTASTLAWKLGATSTRPSAMGCHGRGEYARDEDGDGFCEVPVNTIEGFWSLLRAWLRPRRGISQDKLPDYLGFLYRPGFSGHKILLCGRPYWGACGEPFAPGLSRAAV